MRMVLVFVLGVVFGSGVSQVPKMMMHLRATTHGGQKDATTIGDVLVHTEERFAFTAHAPLEEVASLMGAYKERLWAPGWNPKFIYPKPAADKQAMVFAVAHGDRNSVWVNTEFNRKMGRIQYAYVLPDTLATVITLQLTPEGKDTRVEVEYDRTALSAEQNAKVRQMAEQDRNSGAEWELQVNTYLNEPKK